MNIETFSKLTLNCFEYIEINCIEEVGVYRIPGNGQEVQSVYNQYLQQNFVNLLETLQDKFSAPSLFKHALIHLQEPLIPHCIYPILRAIQIIKQDTGNIRNELLAKAIAIIPANHIELLRIIIQHLYKVVEFKDKNQMNLSNILIIFAPSMLMGYKEEPLEEMKANTQILELLFQALSV